MSKIKIYKTNGALAGYFVDPNIDQFGQNEYEIIGQFFDDKDQLTTKIDFNCEALPYLADLSEAASPPHKHLKNVYVQRGRQPVRMTGCARKTLPSKGLIP
jgi:hypothetical protein